MLPAGVGKLIPGRHRPSFPMLRAGGNKVPREASQGVPAKHQAGGEINCEEDHHRTKLESPGKEGILSKVLDDHGWVVQGPRDENTRIPHTFPGSTGAAS